MSSPNKSRTFRNAVRQAVVVLLLCLSSVLLLWAFFELCHAASDLSQGEWSLQRDRAFLIRAGLFILPGSALAWAMYRIARSCSGLQRTLSVGALLHSALVLGAWFASNHFDFHLPFELWVLIATLWLAWPAALLVLPGCSPARSVLPIALAFVMLIPCAPRLLTFAPSTFGFWRWPTKGLPAIERTQNLGYGFSRITLMEENPPGFFESVGHFEYLFYRGTNLGLLDNCLIAPNGDAVVFQEGASGNIFVFFRTNRKSVQLTPEFPGLALRFVWHQPARSVSAFVVPNSSSDESVGRWIRFDIPST